MKGSKYLETMVQLATTAFGLVAALAWNQAITTLFKQLFGTTNDLVGQLTYAVLVTVLVVTVTTRLAKLAEKVNGPRGE